MDEKEYQEHLLKKYRTNIAMLVTEAARVLDAPTLAQLLAFIAEGAEMNLEALSVPKEHITKAREFYRSAANEALVKTAEEIRAEIKDIEPKR